MKRNHPQVLLPIGKFSIFNKRVRYCFQNKLVKVGCLSEKRQRNQRSNCQHLLYHQKGKRIPEKKNICFCIIDYAKAFDCVDHKNYGKLLNRWEYQTTLPASWEICMQVKKQQLELDMKLQTGSKLRIEYIKAIYFTLLI